MVIHGIPSKSTILKKGDIVGIDTGACIEGFNGDNAWTFACGEISEEARELLEATEKSLFLGLSRPVPAAASAILGHAVQEYVESSQLLGGYEEFVGHGVGAKLHEDPSVPNYGTPGRGVRLLPGMTIAIEPHGEHGQARRGDPGRWLDHGDKGREPFGPTLSTRWPSPRRARSF